MAHVFDLATQWGATSRNILITQGWYGVPEEFGGPDADWGVWNPGQPATWHANDPEAYPRIPYDDQDADLCHGGYPYVGSFLRPLEGLYSTSGRDAASLAHIDRELAVVRRDGDPRGRIDVVAATLGHIVFTSYADLPEDDPTFSYGLDRRWRHLEALISRAEAAGLEGCVTANYEAYQVWQFYSDEYTSKLSRLYAVATDLQGIVGALVASDAAFKLDDRVVIFFYEGTLGEAISPTEWNLVFNEVRKTFNAAVTPGTSGTESSLGTGHDFYVVGSNYGANDVGCFDGLHPWVNVSGYEAATGTEREKAAQWAKESVADFIQTAVSASVANPGRVALGNFSMGFETWVKGWGAGTDDFIPRSLDTLNGQFDGYADIETEWQAINGIVIVTWDDYPEGSCLEPTLQDKGEFLGAWTEAVAVHEGETPDPDDTAALLAIWESAASVVSCPIQATQPGPQARRARRIAHRGPA